jgi:hypothetical protein
MTAEIFLRRFYAKLKWRVSQEEAQDILQDYKEFFEEEGEQGKTDQQICAMLGSPQQVLKNTMSERKQLPRYYLYWPCVILVIVCAILFPLMVVGGDVSGLSWPYAAYAHRAYVLIAPIPMLLLYRVQHQHGYATGISKHHFRLFGGTLLFSFALIGLSSAAFYRFLHDFQERPPSFSTGNASIVRYILMAAVWLIAGVWLVCVPLFRKCGRYAPGVSFLYAALLAIVMHYSGILRAMNFEEMGIPDPPTIVFLPAVSLLIVAAIGAGLWSIYQFCVSRKRGDQ